MRRFSIALASLLLPLCGSLSAFDFTPRSVEVTNLEGNSFIVQYFDHKGTLYKPHVFQSTLSGSAQEALFTYPFLKQATMRLRSYPEIYKTGTLTEETKAKLLEAARTFLPSGSTAISTTIKPCDELEVRDIPACEVTTIYEIPGHRIWQSVIFMSLVPDEPMVMITNAYESDAEEARQLSIRTIRAWVKTTMDELRKPPMY